MSGVLLCEAKKTCAWSRLDVYASAFRWIRGTACLFMVQAVDIGRSKTLWASNESNYISIAILPWGQRVS